MKIGIFSDIHNRLDHLEQAVYQMITLNCKHFIFLGDCTTENSFRRMIELSKNYPLDIVPGNNDYDLDTMHWIATNSLAAHLYPEHVTITRYGLKFSLSHYPKYALQEAYLGNVDIALYGHTHQAKCEMSGNCLLANPGELQGRTGRIGFGIFDTESRQLNLHTLECTPL